MPILSANNITHSFGADDLLTELSVKLEHKERVGLVGPNGVGKTTLLLILARLLEAEEGEVHWEKELSVGYLRQEAVLTFAGQDNTIYEEMLTVFGNLTALETQMRQMEARMSAGEMAEELFNEYSAAQTEYEIGGGYEYQVDIKRVLEGLGFPEQVWQTPLTHLSGGQKTRVLLGRLLLEKPDLLILDEPTNHLDQVAVEWLEKTLRQWPNTLLIVSHDRYFLDKAVNRIWEMTAEQVTTYRGNYSTFVQQRQLAYEQELKAWESEKERLDGELDFVRRHIAGGKTDIAKGKLKRLTRDIVLLEEVGVLAMQNKSWMEIGGRVRTFSANEAAKRLRDLKPPSNKYPTLNIKLKSEERSGHVVLRTTPLAVGYPETVLFKTDKLQLERLDIAALIGPNGSGKSTLLRTVLGNLAPLAGDVELGENVEIGYFAQAHEQLNHAHTVLEEILDHRPSSEQDARAYLAQYLFRGHDVFKRVGDLSGGERGRLALAILAVTGANFLLLDEPTNHLDIPSQETLQEVLERFDGTILLVSHDRYLVNKLATQIWSIEKDKLVVFEGGYDEFVEDKEARTDEKEELTEARVQEILLQDVPDAAELDLGWVHEVDAPQPAPNQKKKNKSGRQGRSELDLAIQDAEIWLEKLQQQLEDAHAAEDPDEIEWLEEEVEQALVDLDELLAERGE